jgi:hypothetical protein
MCWVMAAMKSQGVKISKLRLILGFMPEGKPGDEITDLYWIRDGIMVIPKNTVIPSGTVL